MEGAPGAPEAIYRQGFNEDQPCAVSAGSGRGGHGLCTLKPVIGRQTLYMYVKHICYPSGSYIFTVLSKKGPIGQKRVAQRYVCSPVNDIDPIAADKI